MTSWNAWAWNKKNILLNKLGERRQSGYEIGSVYAILQNKKCFQKILQKMWPEKPFCVYKDLTKTSTEKWKFWRKLIYSSCNSKICENQHEDFLISPFAKDPLKTKEDLKLVFRPHIL